MRLNDPVQIGPMVDHPSDKPAAEIRRRLLRGNEFPQAIKQLVRVIAQYIHGIQDLQGHFSCFVAGAHGCSYLNEPSMASIKLVISIAATAAFQPLLPALVPARSIACSMVSVVMTPKMIGTPVSRLTLAIPLET